MILCCCAVLALLFPRFISCEYYLMYTKIFSPFSWTFAVYPCFVLFIVAGANGFPNWKLSSPKDGCVWLILCAGEKDNLVLVLFRFYIQIQRLLWFPFFSVSMGVITWKGATFFKGWSKEIIVSFLDFFFNFFVYFKFGGILGYNWISSRVLLADKGCWPVI